MPVFASKHALAVGCLLVTSGCFSAEIRGAVCTEDSHCGDGFFCVRDGTALTGKCGEAAGCPDLALASAEPVFADTPDFARKAECTQCFDGAGAGGDAPDVTYEFTPSSAGTYLFHTLGMGEVDGHDGSSFATLLYLFAGAQCGGDELAWDEHTFFEAGDNESLVAAYIGADESVTVVVDGDEGGAGRFGLVAEPLAGACPDTTASGLSHLETGDATGRGNTVVSSCGSALSEDSTVAFTASEAGLYLVELGTVEQPAVVSVRSGLACDGAEPTELACGTRLTLPLEAQEQVTLVADGQLRTGPGEFGMSIARCATDYGAVTTEPVTGTTAVVGLFNAMAPTCRAPDAVGDAAVAAFFFTARAADRYRFDTTASPVPTRIALRDGQRCDGPDLACVNVVERDDQVPERDLNVGDTVVVIVETLGGPGDFSLLVDVASDE